MSSEPAEVTDSQYARRVKIVLILGHFPVLLVLFINYLLIRDSQYSTLQGSLNSEIYTTKCPPIGYKTLK